MRFLSRIEPDSPSPEERRPPPRRRFLRVLGGFLGGAWLTGVLGGLIGTGGCASREGDGGEPAPVETRVPLASLPSGERLRVLHGGRPVELRRAGDGVVARSLVCTHFGCEVAWKPDEGVYACPCHEGRFAPDGRVLGGAPSRPLPEVPVRIEGPTVVLGSRGAGPEDGTLAPAAAAVRVLPTP